MSDLSAQYWTKPITRREAQATFDQFSTVIKQLLGDVHGNSETGHEGLIALIAKLDITVAFLFEKLGITPTEFQTFMSQKMAEFQAAQKAAQVEAEAPVDSPRVTLN